MGAEMDSGSGKSKLGAVIQGWEVVLLGHGGEPVGLALNVGPFGQSVLQTDSGDWVLRAGGVEVRWSPQSEFGTVEQVVASATLSLVKLFRGLADQIVQRSK